MELELKVSESETKDKENKLKHLEKYEKLLQEIQKNMDSDELLSIRPTSILSTQTLKFIYR